MSRSRPPRICRAPSVPAATRALDEGVVPDREHVAVGGREIRDLEVGTPEAADGSGHPADALAHHGRGGVERPRQDPHLLDGLAELVLHIAAEPAGPVPFGIVPPLPIRMPFCESCSTKIVARMYRHSSPARSVSSVTRTAAA